MAKKRPKSAQEKEGNISSVTRGRVRETSNGIVKRSSRFSPKTIASQSMKRSSKSTLELTKDLSQKSKQNLEDPNREATKRPTRNVKKRNLSANESSFSTSKKKPKLESSQVQNGEAVEPATETNRAFSLKTNAKKRGPSKGSHVKKKTEEDLVPESDSSGQIIKEEGEENISTEVEPESHLKPAREITPQNPQGSPRKDKHVKKKLELDLVQSSKEHCGIKQEREGSSSDESSDDEGVAWEDVDEAHAAEHVLEAVHKGNREVSTSHQHQSPSKKNVEISITMPGTKRKKKGWDQEEIMKCVKRAINRFRKETVINVHKVHLLTLVGHGIFRNNVCNDPLLQAYFLSHMPSDLLSGNKKKWDVAKLTSFLQWFQNKFTNIEEVRKEENEGDKKIAIVGNLSEVLVAILRALGLLVRLVYSLQPISLKANVEQKPSQKNTCRKKKTPIKVCKPDESTSEEVSSTPAHPKKRKIGGHKNVKEEGKTEMKKKTENNSTLKMDGKSKNGTKTVKTPVGKSVNSSTEKNSCSKQKESKKGDESVEKKNKELGKVKRSSKIPKGKMGCSSESANASNDDGIGKKNGKKSKRPLRKRKKIDYSLCDEENETDEAERWSGLSSSSESEECEETSSGRENLNNRGKTALGGSQMSTESDSKTPTGSVTPSFIDLLDDDSDFEVTSKPLVRKLPPAKSAPGKRKPIKIVSSDESSDSVQCVGDLHGLKDSNWWAEVYIPVEKKWICVHLESSSINHPELCEEQATQPLSYVISFDNKNCIKDVTNRYASSWMSKTRKLRIDSDWWEDTLLPYKSKNKKMDEMEDSHLEDKLLEKPLPKSITEFKNHPLYVLKRHLLKFEGIYPETAAILGYCRGEAIYSRDCVHLLHTREKWLNEALVVKQGEKPYKVVKGRPKRNQPIHERDSVTIDLFGRWQTERYKPPPAKDGKVPRNEYGNVELFLPCMLPPGTKHIQINGIQRVAKKLGIDCAQAVVGFDFHCGFSHPVIDGVVVCKEFEQVLLDAWREEEEQAEKRKAEKREKRMLANWKLLTRSLLIRERLKKRYDTAEEPNLAETSKNDEDDTVTDTSVSWPLNRQAGKTSVASDGHCHVFPKSGHKQDSVTGEWTKSCSCGLTLPFEKM
ncbi:DNA repair protein complementing XP-C cells homolog [Montipora foliosa]|uniref:DNA repair protein complementing XP-C cells homolog n=1 Tax=Montipora foliosa TaxID=591990 RepID=UPI0035F189E9